MAKEWKMVALLLVLVTPLLGPFAQASPSMRIGVCYYGNYQDWSQITDATLNRDFALFQERGIKVITLPTFWDALEGATPGSYNQAVFARLIHITTVAASYGINVVDNIHTWYTGTNVPAYVGNQRNIYVDPAIQQDWLNFVKYYIRELDASNVESFQVWNELGPESWCMNVSPQQFYDTSQATVSAARSATSKPISARFSGAGATDVEDRVYGLFDYFATNYYDSFNNPSQLQGIIDRATAMGKQVWICEYGDSTTNDAAQASYYANDLNLFQSKGINTAIAWWYSGTAGVGDLDYQIRGRPAFDTMCSYINAVNNPSWTVTTTVTSSGAPVQGFSLAVSGPQAFSLTTNSDGQASFTTPTQGTYSITATKTGYQTATGTVTIDSNTPNQTNLSLSTSTSGGGNPPPITLPPISDPIYLYAAALLIGYLLIKK